MKKHLAPGTMQQELRLAFPSPLEARIGYADHHNVMKFRVFGEKGESLYESRNLPMQGQVNVRLPIHFAFHVSTGREAVEKKTGCQLPPWFREGDAVRWKNADSTDPRNNMRIIDMGKLGGIEQRALCDYIGPRGSIQDALSGRTQMIEPIEEWFFLSELEHISETS